jgi:hypothetical protein
LLIAHLACGSDIAPAPEAKTCDAKCQDGVAARAVRETMKLAFNLTLQGKPVGRHDIRVPCPLGGQVRVVGVATSNATQGSTEVDLTYEFDACRYTSRDDEPEESYSLTVTASMAQRGIIAVQPSATTALSMSSARIDAVGTVYDPPIEFRAQQCVIALQQDGNKLVGSFCERPVQTDL